MHIDQYLDIILRSGAVYLFMVFAIRIFGKKELSQLSTTDLVFIVLISNAVQNAMVGADSSLLGGILAATVLFLLNHFFKLLMFRYSFFKDFVEDKPTILVYNGKTDDKALQRKKITTDELDEAIREHGIDSAKNVKMAILEVDGNISVISGEYDTLRQTHYKSHRKHKSLVRKS